MILWLALRSFKIVLAVSLTLAAGLAITAAVGLLIVGAFNPISLAFAVLCVGLGADFAIQFSVRYRAERRTCGELRKALALTSLGVGLPLTLAAASAAAGFMSFLPTDYIGMAELGLIAGLGMGIAYLASMLLLPALLQIFESACGAASAWLRRHGAGGSVPRTPSHRRSSSRRSLVVLAGLPLLPHLRFDFNPLDLRNPNEEAMATYSELSQDPLMNANVMEVLAASPDAAADVAKKLSMLPQVGQARTIDSFVPDGQTGKIAAIKSAADKLDGVLNPSQRAGAANRRRQHRSPEERGREPLVVGRRCARSRRRCRKASCRRSRQARGRAADRAGVDADGVDPTAGHGPGSPSPCFAAGRRHSRNAPRSHSPLLGEP